MNSLGFQQVAVADAVLTISSFTVPANTVFVEIQADSAGPLRYTLDGSAPTTAAAMILPKDTWPLLVLEIAAFRKLKLIRDGSTGTKINVQYLGTAPSYPADPGDLDGAVGNLD